MPTEQQQRSISVDAALIHELLVQGADLAELKLVLFVVLVAAGRPHPLVPLEEVLTAETIRAVAGLNSPESGEERARESLERALANGWLLRLSLNDEGTRRVFILLATAENRGYVDRLRAGERGMEGVLGLPPHGEASVFRPNAFALYEQFLGPLTPLIAEQIRDAERSYPRWWIEEAIQQAVDYNKPNWRYVQTILSNWEKSGAPHGASRRHS